jgi:hypothetical protein
MDDFETIDRERLGNTCGGESWWSWFVDRGKETLGYAGPNGPSEAASAIAPAGGALALKPQGDARNHLIETLANPTSSGRQVDQAFDRYHNGPGARLAKHVSGF